MEYSFLRHKAEIALRYRYLECNTTFAKKCGKMMSKLLGNLISRTRVVTICGANTP